MYFRKLIHVFPVLLTLLTPGWIAAQITQVQFGQNRVQYHDFIWSFYESDHFTTYFYLGGQDVGKYAIQFAEKILPEIEEKLEYRLNNKIQILVYNDITDRNQTNIGIANEEYNTGGVTNIIENKMFIYFDGNHSHLEQQIKSGIARIILNNMMFGSNLQEILQNAVLLNLPDWFVEGLIAYVSRGWTPDDDNRLRDGILTGRYENFNKLSFDEAAFVGHALWFYVEEVYGKSSVPNLLYLTRINRSLESGFLFVLGNSVSGVIQEWYDYNYDKYMREINDKNPPDSSAYLPVKTRKHSHYYHARLSADGKTLAFASNTDGRFKVFVYDIESKKKKRILKGGIKTKTLATDYNYPLLAWSKLGSKLAVIYEKRDKIYLMLYDHHDQSVEIKPVTKFQRILAIDFMDDPRMLVMSAINRGQSDIYTYYLPTTRTEQITDDYYDDLTPAFVDLGGYRGIVFSSNRPGKRLTTARMDTTLLKQDFDLFFYRMDKRTNSLIRITHTRQADEFFPEDWNGRYFAFLSNSNGINNRFAAYIDTAWYRNDMVYHFSDSIVTNPGKSTLQRISTGELTPDSVLKLPVYKDTAYYFPVSDYASSVLEHDINPLTHKVLEVFLTEGKESFYLTPVDSIPDPANAPVLTNTALRNYLNSQSASGEKPRLKGPSETGTEEETDTTRQITYFFQTEFNVTPEMAAFDSLMMIQANPEKEPIFVSSRVLPYQVKFSTDYVTTQLDNRLIMTTYQKFTPGIPVFENPPLSGMVNLGISDLFEDYKIYGGFRFPTSFKGSEYFMAYEALRKRLDKKLLYYRKVDNRIYDDRVPFTNVIVPPTIGIPVEVDAKTNYFELSLKYPFDVIRSIRGYVAYRHEKFVFKAKDDISLRIPTYAESWLFGKIEYVHDNTVNVATNILNGLRFKIYAEIHKQFETKRDTIFRNLKIRLPKFNDAYLAVFGADFRYYQKIHKQIIWANRLAFGTSAGTRKLLFYLGGVDSWLVPKFDQSVPISEKEDYAFQALATNLRGFKQNIRNGTSYALINSEIRIPIFSYLIHSPIRSEFIKNFQIIGFADVGTAWNGLNPYDESNPLFSETIGNPESAIQVKVNYFRNPLVSGYGAGLRTLLFGYFVRLDVAWGLDSGNFSAPQWYFSMSLDF